MTREPAATGPRLRPLTIRIGKISRTENIWYFCAPAMELAVNRLEKADDSYLKMNGVTLRMISIYG